MEAFDRKQQGHRHCHCQLAGGGVQDSPGAGRLKWLSSAKNSKMDLDASQSLYLESTLITCLTWKINLIILCSVDADNKSTINVTIVNNSKCFVDHSTT